MNKKIAGLSIILIILIDGFFKKKLDYDHFNFPTIIYYILLIACGYLMFKNFKPQSKKKFLVALIIYVVLFLTIVLCLPLLN